MTCLSLHKIVVSTTALKRNNIDHNIAKPPLPQNICHSLTGNNVAVLKATCACDVDMIEHLTVKLIYNRARHTLAHAPRQSIELRIRTCIHTTCCRVVRQFQPTVVSVPL